VIELDLRTLEMLEKLARETEQLALVARRTAWWSAALMVLSVGQTCVLVWTVRLLLLRQ
jgi:hypothetical protein